MGTDINETRNAGTKDETRGTGMNGGVSEMQWKKDGKGIAGEGRAERTCQRSISDQYLTNWFLRFLLFQNSPTPPYQFGRYLRMFSPFPWL